MCSIVPRLAMEADLGRVKPSALFRSSRMNASRHVDAKSPRPHVLIFRAGAQMPPKNPGLTCMLPIPLLPLPPTERSVQPASNNKRRPSRAERSTVVMHLQEAKIDQHTRLRPRRHWMITTSGSDTGLLEGAPPTTSSCHTPLLLLPP